MDTKYKIGPCIICKKHKALKDDICLKCHTKHMPDFLKDLFEKAKEGDKNA
jgi:multimeric flavodoxin WrbA